VDPRCDVSAFVCGEWGMILFWLSCFPLWLLEEGLVGALLCMYVAGVFPLRRSEGWVGSAGLREIK
jgi:hypothetical protein